jgi:hypothetical protein
MEKTDLLHRAITSSVEGYLKYKLGNWTYVVLPNKKDWVVCVADSGYTFYNNDFFSNLFSYLSVSNPKRKRYIKSWAKNVMGFENIDKHFYPDHLYGEYNWSDQFVVKDVLEKGEMIV